MAEPTIRIKYGDWLEEYVQAEKDVSNKEALIERIREGMTTPQVARMALVARERKEADADVLPTCKLMLAAGAMHEVSSLIMRQKREITTKSGKKIKVREFVAPVLDGDEMSETGAQRMEMTADSIKPEDTKLGMVSLLDPRAIQRARRYLFERVPGYIYGRLAILAANDEDVRAAADELIGLIGGIVERLE
jgi:hypothetical protein